MGYAAALGRTVRGSLVLELLAGAGLERADLQSDNNCLWPWPPVLLYLSGVLWTLGYDTVYALRRTWRTTP